MSHFKRRISEALWVVGDQLEDGTWKIDVLDARSQPVTSRRLRAKALVIALREQSKLRTALWEALPADTQAAIREGRA